MATRFELVPVGENAKDPQPGDFLLCHRKGLAASFIRWGERIRFQGGARWSHAALVEDGTTIIEALTRGVVRRPIDVYRDIEYILVRTELSSLDQDQALAFARSCVGQRYGFLTDAGIALRFLTPGRGLWFGMNGTEICSGLVAQALVRGWMIFERNPSAISPAELAEAYGAPLSNTRIKPRDAS